MEIVAMILFPLILVILGSLEGITLRKDIKTWYNKLIKPKYTPPNYLFPIVFTSIYILIGISGYLIWDIEKGFAKKFIKAWVSYFIEVTLQFVWPIFFFKMHLLLFSFIAGFVLVNLILINVILFYQIYSLAAYLLIPYLISTALLNFYNFLIWRLNRFSYDSQETNLMVSTNDSTPKL